MASATGVREVASATAIPCRSRTAAARMARASAGRKWWNAVNTVRNPARCGGTSVALTDSASYRTPGIAAASRPRAAVFGYLSVRHRVTSTPCARSAGRRSGPRAAAAGAEVGDPGRAGSA